MEFFFQEVGKIPSAIFIFPSGYYKKLKPPISPDFPMCNVIKMINLIELPPNDPLPGS